MITECEPINLNQDLKDKNWQEVKKEEVKEILELVNNSSKRTIDVKWVHKLKLIPNGEIAKYKVRLVAKRFLQRSGIDFSEVYAPFSRLETIKVVVAIATSKRCKIHQLDVKSSFLNGPLENGVYIKQPIGLRSKENKKNCI